MNVVGRLALMVIGQIPHCAAAWHAARITVLSLGSVLLLGGAAGLLANGLLATPWRRSDEQPAGYEQNPDDEPPL